MKMVFSNKQVAHVWANQSQSMGKNGANTFFFNDSSIWSYGSHYLAAKIHTKGKKKLALVNSNSYSPTTAKHLSDIRNALQGNIDYVSVKNCDNLKDSVKELDSATQGVIATVLRKNKITSIDDINYELELIQYSFNEANKLRSFLSLKPIQFKEADRLKVKAYLESRLARYNELNTPEMLAVKEANRLKKQAREQTKLNLELNESITEFRQGKPIKKVLQALEYELLRVVNNEIQTSRGASVPLSQALLLLKLINNRVDVIGKRVGHFSVDSITEVNGDRIIQIGCHKVALSEANQVLSNIATIEMYA